MSASNVTPIKPSSQLLPWSGAGCAPAGCGGDMDRLMQCYCDVQAAMKFISKIMIDLINNDPAVAQAMIAAIEKSGSSLPLIGVTNGSDAQPGQVGEYIWFQQELAAQTGTSTQNVSLGVLQPGDWDCMCYLVTGMSFTEINFFLLPAPVPPGFSGRMQGVFAVASAVSTVEDQFVLGTSARALISQPTLIAFTVTMDLADVSTGEAPYLVFAARRAR